MIVHRIRSLLVAAVCVGLAVYVGDPALIVVAALGSVFSLSLIWFADQFASGMGNLMGLSLDEVSPGSLRGLGWVTLLLGALAFLLVVLPQAFPAAG